MKFSKVVIKVQLLTSSCVYPARSLKTLHPHIMHVIITGFPHTGFSSAYCLFQVEMALEQKVKEIHTQNAQLQEIFLNLSKGQEEVKAPITRA